MSNTKALGEDWKTRGARQAEQVVVLRRLWSENLVTFKGRFHALQEVNVVPPPVQRPIPVWFGGVSDAVVMRAARLGDGWMPIMAPDEKAEQKLALLRAEMTKHGRDADKFGIEGWLRMHEADPQRGRRLAQTGSRHGHALPHVSHAEIRGPDRNVAPLQRRCKRIATTAPAFTTEMANAKRITVTMLTRLGRPKRLHPNHRPRETSARTYRSAPIDGKAAFTVYC